MVPEVGIEPTHLAVLDFESSASTSSTTRATEKSGEWARIIAANPAGSTRGFSPGNRAIGGHAVARTGPGALPSARQNPRNSMKLYNENNPAPNPRKVRIYLAEKGLTVEQVRVPIMKRVHKDPEFLKKNSLGPLPVLELDDGTFISE